MSDFVDEDAMEDIRKTLHRGQTESCSIVSLKVGRDPWYKNFRIPASGEIEEDNEASKIIYRLGSLFKPLVAISLHLIIEKLSKSSHPNDGIYHGLNDWEEHFTVAYNLHRPANKRMRPLRGNPTIKDLLVHTNGLPNVNHFIIAPDGTLLMSEDEFVRAAPRLSHDHNPASRVQYSNGNYILAALLIEAVSEDSFGKFLRSKILDPLEMNNTYLNASELERTEHNWQALPHMIYGDNQRRQIKDRTSIGSTIEIATLGIYSCTQDLEKLFNALLTAMAGKPSSQTFDETFVFNLFGENDHISNTFGSDTESYVACGLETNVNSKSLGCQAMNALILDGDYSVSFRLGKEPKARPMRIYYQAGLVTGYSCCVYLIPENGRALLVMTNTLGAIDSADYVSRILLQDMIKPLKNWQRPLVLVMPKKLRGSSASYRNLKENIFDHLDEAANKIPAKWGQFFAQILVTEFASISVDKLTGRYSDTDRLQTLELAEVDDELSVRFCGDANNSTPMKLQQISSTRFQIRPKEPAIDVFGAWKDLTIEAEHPRSGERVKSFSRIVPQSAGTSELRYTYHLESS